MSAPEPIDVVVRGGLICGKCGQPIAPGEANVRALGFYCAHDEERCLALLHQALAEARAENEELRLKLERDMRVEGGVPGAGRIG